MNESIFESKISALILAAGASVRFGAENKLHASLDGVGILERTICSVKACRFSNVLVVARPNDLGTQSTAEKLKVDFALNHNADLGVGSSISVGMSNAMIIQSEGVAIFLGDLPLIKKETIDFLIKRFVEHERTKIVRPMYGDQIGHPVIFPRILFPAMSEIKGDVGARELIQANRDLLDLVEVEDRGVVQDFDTPEDIASVD